MAYLEIETRDGTHRVNLERDRLSIGRLSYNDVVLPFAQISRQHAELRLLNGQWWVADLHSTNGLQVNARRIQEHALTNGDRVLLAPGISVRFVDEAGATAEPLGQPGQAGSSPRPDETSTSWAERIRQQFTLPGSASATSMTQPSRPSSSADPFVPPASFAPLRPRSPFSDDEVRYVPPGMQPSAPPASSSQPGSYPSFPAHSPGTLGVPNGFPSGVRDNPFAAPQAGAVRIPGTSGANGGNGALAGAAGNGSGGYPAPPGPLRAGADPGDPFLREGPMDERQRATSGPAPKLLHVCQTCGQLTAPDSVYCQSCHHSIAHECANCRLSLLPIQERCPRCHTPNQLSVRRTHPGRSDI